MLRVVDQELKDIAVFERIINHLKEMICAQLKAQLQQSESVYCEVSGVKLDSKPERKPHICPVCTGNGIVWGNE